MNGKKKRSNGSNPHPFLFAMSLDKLKKLISTFRSRAGPESSMCLDEFVPKLLYIPWRAVSFNLFKKQSLNST